MQAVAGGYAWRVPRVPCRTPETLLVRQDSCACCESRSVAPAARARAQRPGGSELTELVGEPQSLVSYHLGQLRAGGLVRTRRSSADRRDSYYARRSRLLPRAAPSRRRRARIPGCGSRRRRRRDAAANVRGSEAAGLVPVHGEQRALADRGGAARAMSEGPVDRRVRPGSHPKPLHPNAVRVMKQRGHRHQREPHQAPRRVRRATLRHRDHAVRPRPRGVPGVPVAPAPRALEHPRPGARGRDRPRHLARVRTHGDRARDAHRVPARSCWTNHRPRRSTHAER